MTYPAAMYSVYDRAVQDARKRLLRAESKAPDDPLQNRIAQKRRESLREVERQRNDCLAAIIAHRKRGVGL